MLCKVTRVAVLLLKSTSFKLFTTFKDSRERVYDRTINVLLRKVTPDCAWPRLQKDPAKVKRAFLFQCQPQVLLHYQTPAYRFMHIYFGKWVSDVLLFLSAAQLDFCRLWELEGLGARWRGGKGRARQIRGCECLLTPSYNNSGCFWSK